jgi:hypothetical protein
MQKRLDVVSRDPIEVHVTGLMLLNRAAAAAVRAESV